MNLYLDLNYIAKIKKDIVDIPKVLDGLSELIGACHNRLNVLTKRQVTMHDPSKPAPPNVRNEVNDEIDENIDICGKLNYLFDILSSLEKGDATNEERK